MIFDFISHIHTFQLQNLLLVVLDDWREDSGLFTSFHPSSLCASLVYNSKACVKRKGLSIPIEDTERGLINPLLYNLYLTLLDDFIHKIKKNLEEGAEPLVSG